MSRFILTIIIISFISIEANAQRNGILPFSGIKYFRNGIWGKSFELKIKDETWMGNKIPINTEYEIELLEPTGFIKDDQGKYHPGVSLLITNSKKDTLGFAENIFGDQTVGMDAFRFKSLTLTLGFNDKVKPGDTCYQYITYYDKKGSSKLRLEFPVIIIEPTTDLQTTASLYTASGTRGYNAHAGGGIELKKIEAYIDSTYYPKSLYYMLRSAEMQGITTEEINQGKFSTWIYDENMNEMPISKPSNHFAAKTFKEGEQINVLVKIALNPEDKKNKDYTARYRWESLDGKKVLDIVNKF